MFRFSVAVFVAAESAAALDCSCNAPDNCYHSSWAVPCSDASDQAACEASGGDWCGQGPTPSPAPQPTPTPAPTPAPPAPAGDIIGYWDKTWAPGAAPTGANLGVAFNGWADPAQALSDSAGVYNDLAGTKYISIGGGNANGSFSLERLQDLVGLINSGSFEGWHGIALDVEECSETGLASAFLKATAAAKAKGFDTMVTVSHSAPYGCTDASELMSTFFADSNTDYVSPQLYSSGAESSPDFAETTDAGVPWSQYVGMRAKLIPSVVDGTHYSATRDFFAALGVPVAGYVQWKTVGSATVVV